MKASIFCVNRATENYLTYKKFVSYFVEQVIYESDRRQVETNMSKKPYVQNC